MAVVAAAVAAAAAGWSGQEAPLGRLVLGGVVFCPLRGPHFFLSV